MSNTKAWISAFRLRTLPLAVASISMGSIAAAMDGNHHWDVTLLALLTAFLLQILSNLANDYGDFKNGADNDDRLGPQRAVASGAISEKAMLRAIILFVVLSLVSGISLLVIGIPDLFVNIKGLLFFLVGIAAIVAAIKYTAGKNPYGYSGLGDLSVFIFFGIVAVMGTYYLQTNEFNLNVLLPASAFGLLSTGVLNVNNIRDIVNDEETGKITIPVKLGAKKARGYHLLLILTAFVLTTMYFGNASGSWLNYLFLLSLPLYTIHTVSILKSTSGDEQMLNTRLKQLVFLNLLYTLLFGLGALL